MFDTKRLFDVTTRLQVYVEGVKLYQINQFSQVILHVQDELKELLPRIRYDTLDGMTKAELNALIVTLRKFQQRIYNRYTQGLIDQLQDFMTTNIMLQKRVFASLAMSLPMDDLADDAEADEYFQTEQEQRNGIIPMFGWSAIRGTKPDDFAGFWSRIANAPIPGNGMLLATFLASFSTTAQASVENLVRMGYANGWTVRETLAAIVGTSSANGRDGKLNTIGNQASAVIDTVTAHVSAMVNGAIQSALFEWYLWISVMDARTSAICQSRNKKRYRYGVGPLPPAHMRCRSHTIPDTGDDDNTPPTFYNWASNQSSSFLSDVFGNQAATDLKNGNAKSADYDAFKATKPISVADFGTKDEQILST